MRAYDRRLLQLAVGFSILGLVLLSAIKCSAQEVVKPFPKWMVVSASVLQAADIATTQIALRQGGTYEANPLVSSRPNVNLVVGSLAATGQVWLMHYLNAKHPKVARAAFWTLVAMKSYALPNNIRVIQDGRHP